MVNPTFKLVEKMSFEDPPENAWAWLVAAGTWIIHLLLPLAMTTYGIIYVDLVMTSTVSATTIGWIFTLQHFFWNFSGIIAGPLCEQFGDRKVALVGSFFCSSSIVLTGFIKSSSLLFLFYSLIYGFGIGVTFPTCHFVATHYFKKRRGLVLGFIKTFQSGSSFIGPLLVVYLQDVYSNRGAIFILGAIMLNTCVCAMVFHPVDWHRKSKSNCLIHNNVSLDFDKERTSMKHQESNDSIKLKDTVARDRMQIQNFYFGDLDDSVNVTNMNPDIAPFRRLSCPPFFQTSLLSNDKSLLFTSYNKSFPDYFGSFNSKIHGTIRNDRFLNDTFAENKSVLDNQAFGKTSGESYQIRDFRHVTSRPSSKDAVAKDLEKHKAFHKEPQALTCHGEENRKTIWNTFRELAMSTYKSFHLFKSHRVKIMCAINALLVGAYVTGLMMIPFVLNERGYTLKEASWAVSSMSIANMSTRLLLSLVDSIPFPKRYVVMFGTLCYSAGLLAYALSSSLSLFLYAGIAFGVGMGCCLVLLYILIIEVMGVEYFPRVVTVNSLIVSFTTGAFGPTMGFIRDSTGDYKLTIIVLALFGLLTFALLLLIPWAAASDRKRKMAQVEIVQEADVDT